jgi:penicillin-binding protein 1A
VIRTARITGIHTPIPEFRSIALGTAEVTLRDPAYAYGVFANRGIRVEPYFVTASRISPAT